MVWGFCLGLPLLTGSVLFTKYKYITMLLVLLSLILFLTFLDCNDCTVALSKYTTLKI